MRIAFIYRLDSPYINGRAKYLLKKNHEIYYFVLPRGKDEPVPDGVKKEFLSPSFLERIGFLKFASYIRQLSYLTRKNHIDIFHVEGMGFCIHALFSQAKRLVLENQGSDLLIISNSPTRKAFRKLLYRISYKFADAVVQDSAILQKCGIAYGAPINNNEVIPFGVDFNKFNLKVKSNCARVRLGISKERKMVFCSRAFKALYNNDVIIESIPIVKRYFPDAVFVFCNRLENLNRNYLELVRKLNVQDNVVSVGRLSNDDDMPYFCRDADVVVSVPSSDSSPLSVYEAMACGTPVIISDLPWYKGKFEKDSDVIVVPARNAEKLGHAIVRVLSGDKIPNIHSCYRKVFDHLNSEKENHRLEKLYEEILIGKKL